MDRVDALRALVLVADLGSFTAAAKRLRVSQPTLSRWISDLEEELGAELLSRTTRTVRATDAGMLAIEHAREIHGRFESLKAQLGEGRTRLTGTLRLSLPVVFGRLHLLPLLSTFKKRHPQLRLSLEFSDRYVNLVEEGFHCAVRVGQPVDSNLRAVVLGSSCRRLVAAPSYLRRRKAPCDPDGLHEHQCLTFTGTEKLWRFEELGSAASAPSRPAVQIRPRGDVEANNTDALLQLALAGHGVALLADWLVADPLETGELTLLLPQWGVPPAPVHALVAATRFVPAPLRALLDHLQKKLRLPRGGGPEHQARS